MSDKIDGIKCPRCKLAGSINVHTVFRDAVWFQDIKCGHIFEIKKENLAGLGITEGEVIRCNATIARDL